ncbi:MAG: response regulator [Candidatus Cloacimonetes bacterium]|nr:response regulator [Candidatus Cloacimonadota bacterium]
MGNRILIVEDEVLIREMLKEIFLAIFPEVYTADNGESGLLQYNRIHPDLVITDIKMRKMDGLTMIDKIKEINETQKFIVITAYSDEEHQRRVRKQGIDHLLVKPIDCRNLIDISKNLLKNV